MRKVFEIGGMAAAAILIAFGIAAIVMGVNGRSTVQSSLAQEKIVGSPDMTPAAIKAEAQKAGLPATISFPTTSVAGKAIDTGARARAFASYMRIHALEATGGLTYAQMGRFVAKPGTPSQFTDGHGATSDEKYALIERAMASSERIVELRSVSDSVPDPADPVSLVFNGLMAASAGIFGGYLAVMRPGAST